MDEVHLALGKSVLRALVAADLSVPEAAAKAGIAPGRLQRLIDAKAVRTFTVTELHALARASGKPMTALLPKSMAS